MLWKRARTFGSSQSQLPGSCCLGCGQSAVGSCASSCVRVYRARITTPSFAARHVLRQAICQGVCWVSCEAFYSLVAGSWRGRLSHRLSSSSLYPLALVTNVPVCPVRLGHPFPHLCGTQDCPALQCARCCSCALTCSKLVARPHSANPLFWFSCVARGTKRCQLVQFAMCGQRFTLRGWH